MSGHRTKHEFDVVVANGKHYFAAQGISFEVQVRADLQNSIAWKISDVKEHQPDFPLAIVTLPPNPKYPAHKKLERNYQKVTSMYSKLGADILTEDNMGPWVKDHLKPIDTTTMELI